MHIITDWSHAQDLATQLSAQTTTEAWITPDPDLLLVAGVPFYYYCFSKLQTTYPTIAWQWVFDCGTHIDMAMTCLQYKIPRIIFRGDPSARLKLQSIAHKRGLVVAETLENVEKSFSTGDLKSRQYQ